ncbi:MAG TPA: hypothetical protein VMU95_09270 [Trebonia sp.]|nr:hypothetical protein [Trebonia sp.]
MTGAATRTGPLPRTPFALLDEEACHHDRPAEPNNVHLEVLVPGHLDERALRQAVGDAIAAAPRASARMVAGHPLRRRYLWEFPAVPDVDPVSRAAWSDEDELVAIRDRFLATVPSLRASPPVRLLLATGPRASCLLLNVHHAALDGLSTLALMRDIAARYQAIASDPRHPAPGHPGLAAAGTGPSRPGLPPVASSGPPAVPACATPPAPSGGPATAPACARPSAPVQSARRYPVARIAPDRDRGGRRDGQAVRLLSLPAVPRPAPGVTVTDLLVAALIATVARWNAAHRRGPRAIAVSVPVSVHGPAGPTVAGNQTRLVTVTVSPSVAAGQLPALVAEVSRQLAKTRKARPDEASAGILEALPGWCPLVLKRLAIRVALATVGRVVCDTTMLSNLGNVTGPPWSRPGGPVRIAFSAPVHMPRGLAVSVVTADGQPQVAFRYQYALLGDAAAARLVEMFAATLKEIADVEGDVHGPAGGIA